MGPHGRLAGEVARRCRARWPQIALELGVLEGHLEEHLGGGARPAAPQLDELYLACAAGQGDPAALQLLDAEYLARLGPALVRLQGPSTLADDVRQQLRETLFLPASGRRPRILDFAGRSALLAWLKAAAVRKALNLLGQGGAQLDDGRFVDQALAGSDPELDALKARDSGRVREALHAAVRALPADVRQELKQYYLEGLDLKAMGRLYGVSVSAVSRRLARSRDQLHEALRRELGARFELAPRDADSLVRGVQARLESSRVTWWG